MRSERPTDGSGNVSAMKAIHRSSTPSAVCGGSHGHSPSGLCCYRDGLSDHELGILSSAQFPHLLAAKSLCAAPMQMWPTDFIVSESTRRIPTHCPRRLFASSISGTIGPRPFWLNKNCKDDKRRSFSLLKRVRAEKPWQNRRAAGNARPAASRMRSVATKSQPTHKLPQNLPQAFGVFDGCLRRLASALIFSPRGEP